MTVGSLSVIIYIVNKSYIAHVIDFYLDTGKLSFQ